MTNYILFAFIVRAYDVHVAVNMHSNVSALIMLPCNETALFTSFNSIDIAIIMHACMLLHGAVICMKCSSASNIVCASVICANSFIYASNFISASSAISTNPLSFLSSFFYPSFFPITFITFPVQNIN